MPQLDTVTFFSQFFWLCIFYIGFYYILYKYFLPQYSRSILFRDKFTKRSIKEGGTFLEEKTNIEESLKNLTVSAVGFSKEFFEECKSNTGNWQQLSNKKTNEKWKAANLLYINLFGGRGVSKNLSSFSISYPLGKELYSESLLKICGEKKRFGFSKTSLLSRNFSEKSKKKPLGFNDTLSPKGENSIKYKSPKKSTGKTLPKK